MGFYFVCIVTIHSEFFFTKRDDFGCNFLSPPNIKLHPKLYRLALLCLPWSQTI